MEQRVTGTLRIWASRSYRCACRSCSTSGPILFERADVTSNTYYDWFMDNAYIVLAASALAEQFLATFEEFPPRQKAASFTIDHPVEKLEAALAEGSEVPEPLASWNDTPTRAAIVDFVEGAAQAITVERVAVFDNDGTLRCEKPMPIELGFIRERLAEMAE